MIPGRAGVALPREGRVRAPCLIVSSRRSPDVRHVTIPPMRSHRRSTAAALLLFASLVLATAACTGGDDDDAAPSTDSTAAGTTVEWPQAIDPAAATDAFWVVW